MTLTQFTLHCRDAMLDAIRRGEAPLSGAIEHFVKLCKADRRQAGKVARELANSIGKHQTGTRRYRHALGHSDLALFT